VGTRCCMRHIAKYLDVDLPSGNYHLRIQELMVRCTRKQV